ncbi:MAG: type II toxin-antitoxin system PemK/MazF family toxin [Bifidobacteriaceae bacterium]|jgi:mRNA interferase MazF|nr:type II toxin-antitoxin system PemK/MazF family toxin [Bifidobacteriaceae bacterium]
MVIERGDIYWVDLGEPGGGDHRPAKYRPVLVVQADAYNRTRLATVVAASITSNLDAAQKPGNVFLPRESTGLPKDSVANLTQLSALNRFDLIPERVGRLSPVALEQIDGGLRMILGL